MQDFVPTNSPKPHGNTTISHFHSLFRELLHTQNTTVLGCTYVDAYMYMYMYTHTHSVHVHVHVHTHTVYMYMYTHIHTNIKCYTMLLYKYYYNIISLLFSLSESVGCYLFVLV